VDSSSVGSVVSGQFRVQLGDSSIDGYISEFLVHVDDLSSASVLADNTVGLDTSDVLLEDFGDT